MPDPSRQVPSFAPLGRGRRLWVWTALAFGLSLLLFTFLYAPSPLIYDADSYYHLAVAREYSQQGIIHELEGVRFGLLAQQFGDKEVLFHLLLAPFTRLPDAGLGGRLALGLLGALILTLLAHLSLRTLGVWGVLVPFWLVFASPEFTWRLVRLRPELLSLLLIMLALWAAGRGRYRLLGLLGLVYALSYTAVHAFVGLFILVFLAHGLALRRWSWRLLLYPVLGAAVGLAVHPQFPDNLAVWWFQSVEYFRFKGSLDVGTEIRPNYTDVVLMVNLGWFLGLAVLWRSTRAAEQPRRVDPLTLSFGTGAAVFALLYLLMSRFAVYFMPLATLWWLHELRRRGRALTGATRLPWRGRIPMAAAWALCLLVSAPVSLGELARYRERNSPGPDQVRITDRRALAARLPAGARVAAPWQATPLYLFWAPQARYVNVLDPMFLAAVDPQAHRVQEVIFDGSEPDVPFAATVFLDSPFVAFPSATGNRRLIDRLTADPRVETLHRGVDLLFRTAADKNLDFVLDWRVVPAGSPMPPHREADLETWEEYPRSDEPGRRALEAYVDVRRVIQGEGCLGLVHSEKIESPSRRLYEFAPYGPAALWLDGELVVEVQEDHQAVLGRGPRLGLILEPGEHSLAVLSCPSGQGDYAGFYLLERHRSRS